MGRGVTGLASLVAENSNGSLAKVPRTEGTHAGQNVRARPAGRLGQFLYRRPTRGIRTRRDYNVRQMWPRPAPDVCFVQASADGLEGSGN